MFFGRSVFSYWVTNELLLCEKCPNTELFLVRIFLYAVRIKSIGSKNVLVLWLNFRIFSCETITFQLFAIKIFAFAVVKTKSWRTTSTHYYIVSVKSIYIKNEVEKRVISKNYCKVDYNGSMIKTQCLQ